jgi:hypothetical protein
MNFGHSYWFKPVVAGDEGGDYVTITVDSSLTIEEDMYDSDYKYFVVDETLTSAFTVTNAGDSAGSDSIEVYCIGGGGGASSPASGSGVGASGGGGAGGFIRNLSFNNGSAGLAQTYDVTVGGGGDGGTGAANTQGNDSQVYDTASRSIEFDGVDDDIVCDDSDAWNFGTDPYTVETWAYIRDDTTSQALISTYDGGSQSPYGWYLGIYGGAYKQFYYYLWSGGWIDIDVEPYLNKWTHIAVCRDSTSTNAARFYINGKLEKTFTEPNNYGPASGSDYDLTLGRYSQNISSSGWFDGKLASVRISDTARYSSDFSPPFELFENDSNTLLLIQPVSSDSGWVDLSSSPKTLTGSGASQSTNMPTMRGFGGGAASCYAGSDVWDEKMVGGSGGGGSYSLITGPDGFNGQGNKGGDRGTYGAGGGGGAGTTPDASLTNVGGDGGEGWTDDDGWMDGNSLGFDGGYFAGGGGAGNGGSPGIGGGGDGTLSTATSGEEFSGGGGGGERTVGYDGGAGGSGKVIIRWKFQN